MGRTRLVQAAAVWWAAAGATVAAFTLSGVNDDARLFVATAHAVGLATAWLLSGGRDRSAGAMLVVSAIVTPTYLAYPLSVLVLAVGAWLLVTARDAAPGRNGAQTG